MDAIMTYPSPSDPEKAPAGTVLVLGVYLAGQKNGVRELVEHFKTPCRWNVVQKWVGIGDTEQSEEVKSFTVTSLQKGTPKFILLNALLAKEDLTTYDFIIVCDDDIVLPENFLERYLDAVTRYDFAMAQPARTHNSYIDHHFVNQLDGLMARRTRFVEIGPLFSIRKDLYGLLLPFDERSPMGWGYDFVWPCLIEGQGLRMGIVDATPVEHSMRRPVKNYRYEEALKAMEEYLAGRPHVSKGEAFTILESYA